MTPEQARDPLDLARLAKRAKEVLDRYQLSGWRGVTISVDAEEVLALLSALGAWREEIASRLLVAGQASVEGPRDPTTEREVAVLEWALARFDARVRLPEKET